MAITGSYHCSVHSIFFLGSTSSKEVWLELEAIATMSLVVTYSPEYRRATILLRFQSSRHNRHNKYWVGTTIHN